MNCRRDRAPKTCRSVLLVLVMLAAAFCCPRSSQAAKNVILMISDGAGYNTWLAASMYQGKVGKQVYDQPGWIPLSCSTHPLNLPHEPTGDTEQNPAIVYDPLKAWDATPRSAIAGNFAGCFYLIKACTDSAAAGTALATGRKTYNSAINWSNDNQPLREQTIAEIAKAQGKSVGVVTSVMWSHATPACLGGAHNISRNHYVEIANEMLDADWLDVIMGAGHPDFDNDGLPIPDEKKRGYKYVGGQKTWEGLKQGQRDWKLIENKADFEALATGPTPSKVLGTAQVASTLQEKRDSDLASLLYDKVTAKLSPERRERLPFAVRMNPNAPSLATMAKAAMNCLDDDPDGFYLMIEGGAVDWANHANEPDRMIEEQIDFLGAVETVVEWIESHGGWDETLLILTADHETGLIWGPDSSKEAFQPLEDHGPGKLPGMKFNSHGHSNSLVPLYTRGPGSRRFAALVKGKDPTAAAHWLNSSQYVDNTDIFTVMQAEVTAENDNRSSAK